MKHMKFKDLLAILFVALFGIGVVSCNKEHADKETVKKEFFRFMRLIHDNPKENLEITSIKSDSLCIKKQRFRSVCLPAEIEKIKELLEDNPAEDAEFVEGRVEDEQNCFDAIKRLEKHDSDKVYEYELACYKAMEYTNSMLNGWQHTVYYRDTNSNEYNQLIIIESEDGEFTAPFLCNNASALEKEFNAQNKELQEYYWQYDADYRSVMCLCYHYMHKYLGKTDLPWERCI